MPGCRGLEVVVAGAGTSGRAAARALLERGARVRVADASADRLSALAEELPGVEVLPLVGEPSLPDRTGLVVTSPGWRPDAPLLLAAAARGVEVIGEVELAWRVAQAEQGPDAAPWLVVTGTNGKTTTVRMLASVLSAAGLDTVATGNVGLPLLTAVSGGHRVLAVELSSFQLHWSSSLVPHTAVVLNVAPDHLDWHGSLPAYAAAKGRVYAPATRAVFSRRDPESVRLAASSPRRTGIGLAAPAVGELGVVQGMLVDRAFADPGAGPGAGGSGERAPAVELASTDDVAVPGAHNVENALAAAALARSYGVPAAAVRAGLRAFVPDPHRNATVRTVGGVAWVDDSKATNPHAAAASLSGYDSVVWVAGGLLKGGSVEELVHAAAFRLAGVVLLGTDRAAFVEALLRHAPQVPVRQVARLDTGAMSDAVSLARALARPGDTVLLAPAAASMDCFTDYRQRGELFAAAVRALEPRG